MFSMARRQFRLFTRRATSSCRSRPAQWNAPSSFFAASSVRRSCTDRMAAPVVLHLIDSFGIGGAQQRYFNDLDHLGAPFEHWACAVFGPADHAPQGATVAVPMRSLGVT